MRRILYRLIIITIISIMFSATALCQGDDDILDEVEYLFDGVGVDEKTDNAGEKEKKDSDTNFDFEWFEDNEFEKEDLKVPVDSSFDKGNSFGINVGYYFPGNKDFKGSLGFGFVCDLNLSLDSVISISVNMFNSENVNDSVKTKIYLLEGNYLKCVNNFFIGGGGGIGISNSSDIDELSRFVFAEFKTGYAINKMNRLLFRYTIPLNTDTRVGVTSLGYEFLF